MFESRLWRLFFFTIMIGYNMIDFRGEYNGELKIRIKYAEKEL